MSEYLSCQGINDLVHPDDRALAENNFQELLAHPGDGRTTELRLQHKDGRWLWLEITAVNYLNDPQVAAILFSSHDITTYKAKEHALQANFERYRLLADTIPDALYVAAIGPDQRPTRVLEVNERACQMLGYSRDELLQMNVYDINALGSRINPEVTERMDKGEHVLFEQVHRKHDGTPIPVEVHVRRGLIDGQPVLIGLAHDISHRKLIESELRRFEAAIRQTGDAIVITDSQLDQPPNILFVNDAFTKITGYTIQDAAERKINLMQLSIIGFFDHEEVAVLHDAIRSGSVYRGIIPSRHKNGTLLTLQWSITPVTDQQGLVTHHIAVIRDITEQEKQVAQTRAIKNDLQTQRDQLNDILNTMQDALMSISLVDRQLICASASFKSIFGYPPEAFIQDANFFRQVVPPDDLERTIVAMQTALRDGFIELEHRVIWPDGQVRWLLRRAWVNYDKNGRPIRVNDSARDITERKQAQEALKESEETHRLILGSISDAVFVTDASGTFSFICPNVHVIFGYSRDEVSEMGRIDRLLGSVSFNADTLANVGEIANIEHQILDKSNQPHDLLVTVKLVTLHTGTVLYTCRDITERKHAEDALRASEERLRSVISSVNAHIYVTKITRDKTFINEYMSPNITTISGFSPQKFLDDWNFWLTLVNPDDLRACELQLQKLIAGQSSIVEYRLRLENEHEIWVQDNAKVVSHPDGTMTVFATVQDITERKQAELALIESEQKLRLFVEYSPAAIAMLDKNMRYISVSRRWLTDYRLKEEDITGRSHYEVFPEIPERWKEIHRRCLQGAVETSDADPFPRADGTLDWVHWEIRPWRDVNHEVGGILLFSEVITERINAQDALRASEERYRQMFELHGLPKLIIDPQNGRILDANPAAATFYGYDRAALCTLNIFDINLSPQHEVETKMAKAADSEMLSCAFIHRGAGGDPRHVEVFTGPVEIDGRKLLYSIITDVTEKEHAKAALQEAHDLLEQRVIERTTELEKSNNRLEAIFNHSGDAIVLLDVTHGIQQANYAFDAIFNLSDKQYIGVALTHYLHPQDTDRVAAIIQQVAHTHQGQRIETRIQQPDASIIDLEINIAPVNRSHHAVNSLVCIIRDVTERKQAERAIAEERNLLRTVIDTVPDYIYVKDNHHRIVL
ncbi:MAG: PAS domain S-box protein [Anaerolineae bacterium]